MKNHISKLFISILFLSLLGNVKAQFPYIFDMVHHNPGEVHFVTNYNDPQVIKSIGVNGKVFFLFESGVMGINWSTFDPAVLPVGTADRTWVDAKAAEINKDYDAAKAAGLQVYCMSDLMVFPKRLVDKYKMTTSFKDIRDTLTQRMLREELRMMFRDFPQLDGIVVRIGETYMQDAPYHVGGVVNQSSTITIVPLLQILREEVCVKLNKKVFFRTWLSFDTNLTTYNAVSAAVEPHDNLIISVKHCEGDFHRGNAFSKVLGAGRHKQLVEVQAAREYEGKGAFPNYFGNGVIDGFEEYKNTMPTAPITSLKQLYEQSPLLSGVWTWSKGGGWDGPYITNDMWNELNTWVISKWAQNPTRSEADIFNDYASQKLGLSGTSLTQFRTLALLSAQAVIRGHRSTFADIDTWWTRDHYISEPPALPVNAVAMKRVIDEKHEAVSMFKRIVNLADSINMPDPVNRDYMRISARYGLYLHQIYAIAFDLKLLSMNSLSGRTKIDSLIVEYDKAWKDFNSLYTNNANCATLYKDRAFRNTTTGSLGTFVNAMRTVPTPKNGKYIQNLQSAISTNLISLHTMPQIGDSIYSDRAYKFTQVPECLTGGEYVVWKNDYKNYTTSPMITFSVNTDGKLYIAHDDRLVRPVWLTDNFGITDVKMLVSDANMTLFGADVKKDELVSCGENHLMGNITNSTQYIVFFVPNNVAGISPTDNWNTVNIYSKNKEMIVDISAEKLGGEYEMMDISGKTIRMGKFTQTHNQLPVNAGFYLLKTSQNGVEKLIRKVVVL